MSYEQFQALIATIITVGAVLLGAVKLIIDRAISIKLNGMPQRVIALEDHVGSLRKDRHDFNNRWSDVTMLKVEFKHLSEKLDIKSSIDELRRKLT
jgi:hypothetical protein